MGPDVKVRDFGRAEARRLLPIRKRNANKSDGGRALIVAGSKGYFGAAVLSATAASRVGAGYVSLLTDAKNFPVHRHPDFLIRDRAGTRLRAIPHRALGIGPGLGLSATSLRLLREARRLGDARVVVDADALTLAAKAKLFPFPNTWISTPHEGELGRILGVSANRIRADRPSFALRAQREMGGIVLLKGAGTLIAAPDQSLTRIASGNTALAKAGTGDVLTGILTGLLAQGLEPLEAARLGTYLHGFLADEWIRDHDTLALLASDLLEILPRSLFRLRKKF